MDVMSPEKRSNLVSCTCARDTGRAVQEILQRLNMQHEAQVRESLETPGFVLGEVRRAGLVDGDFGPGWRLPKWEHELAVSGATRLPRIDAGSATGFPSAVSETGRCSACASMTSSSCRRGAPSTSNPVAGLRDPDAVTEPAR